MTERIEPPPYLVLGEILRPHGVKGELRVRILTDYPERIPTLKYVFVGSDPKQSRAEKYEVESVRLLPEDIALVKFVGINDRNDVEVFRERLIMIDTANAIPLDEDEYYAYELIGLTVITVEGRVLGKITDIMETGANDVIIVEGAQVGELLIPDLPEIWVNLDFEQGFATVNLPDGLLLN